MFRIGDNMMESAKLAEVACVTFPLLYETNLATQNFLFYTSPT